MSVKYQCKNIDKKNVGSVQQYVVSYSNLELKCKESLGDSVEKHDVYMYDIIYCILGRPRSGRTSIRSGGRSTRSTCPWGSTRSPSTSWTKTPSGNVVRASCS